MNAMIMMTTALKTVKFAMMMMILLTGVPSERRLLSADFCRPQLQVTSVLCQQRKGLKVVTIEIIEIVTTIIVTTFKRCNNLNML